MISNTNITLRFFFSITSVFSLWFIDKKLMTFHLEDAAAVDIAVMGDGENLL